MTDETVDYSGWSDEDLAAEQNRLATERTRVRLAQVAVANELEVRAALAGLSVRAAEVFRLRVSGSVGPTGDGEQIGVKP